MSKYTTELRFICEKYAGLDESVGYNSVEEVLNNSWEKVFDFDFPIFDEDYRSVICKKILKHYYTREISYETVGIWKLKLDTLMNEIMPYYNQLYKSTLLEWNPLFDADYTKTHEGSGEGTGKDTGKHTGTVNDSGSKEGSIGDTGSEDTTDTTWDVYSDTPQGALTNVDNNTYLTNARKVTRGLETDTSNDREYEETNGNLRTYNEGTTMDRVYNNTDEYVDHIVGKYPGKSYASLIKEFRDTFLNIDVDVIGELSDLFIKLW